MSRRVTRSLCAKFCSAGLVIGLSFEAAGAVSCLTRDVDKDCITPTAVIRFIGARINIAPGIMWCEDEQDTFTTFKRYPCGVCVAGELLTSSETVRKVPGSLAWADKRLHALILITTPPHMESAREQSTNAQRSASHAPQ